MHELINRASNSFLPKKIIVKQVVHREHSTYHDILLHKIYVFYLSAQYIHTIVNNF